MYAKDLSITYANIAFETQGNNHTHHNHLLIPIFNQVKQALQRTRRPHRDFTIRNKKITYTFKNYKQYKTEQDLRLFYILWHNSHFT